MTPGPLQILVILVIVLLLFGSKRIRNLGSDLGKAFTGFKKEIKKDQLVCLFNGIRRFKEGRVVRIGANDDGWSDYRITLGMTRKFPVHICRMR